MQQSTEFNKTNIWEQMASRYDTADRVALADIIAAATRAQLKDTENLTLLDYGCGTGLVGLNLVKSFSTVLFIDASAQMLELLEQKIVKKKIKNATTLCCDFLVEVPPNVQVDYVILSQVLLHIPDTRLILTRLYNVIKTQGHLIVVDFDKNERILYDKVHNGFEQQALKSLIGHIGFSSANSRTFHHGNAIFMNQDASLFILNAKK